MVKIDRKIEKHRKIITEGKNRSKIITDRKIVKYPKIVKKIEKS